MQGPTYLTYDLWYMVFRSYQGGMLRALVNFKVTGMLKKTSALITAGLLSVLLSVFGIFVQSV